jgi:hypothetical protein
MKISVKFLKLLYNKSKDFVELLHDKIGWAGIVLIIAVLGVIFCAVYMWLNPY